MDAGKRLLPRNPLDDDRAFHSTAAGSEGTVELEDAQVVHHGSTRCHSTCLGQGCRPVGS